jgi:hypothetical protein
MIDLFFSWYFVDIPKQIKKVWFNYLWFFEKYFAISELVKDYVSPWKGLNFERETIGFDFGEMAYVVFSNAFSRFVGILIRSIALAIGAMVMVMVFICGIISFIVWVVLLFAIVYGFFKGFMVLFSLLGK